jgi:hypothetical protein
MCGGTGRMSNAAIYLRDQFAASHERERRLQHIIECEPCIHDDGTAAAQTCGELGRKPLCFACWLRRAQKQVART